ncbi:hypothetical protein BSZ36_09135 [Rubricoccus marinus]|uniref:Uncharacterized protein n=1 Tax=Rubricoccus marinus TaxID=716817 RepID=A0A259TZE2_9BACT|nr:hypothetical protein BSZ36_09135 [Rubricoccus marinus]
MSVTLIVLGGMLATTVFYAIVLWAIHSGPTGLRLVMVASAALTGGMLWDGVRRGEMNGNSRDTAPVLYYLYLASYTMLFCASVGGALFF